MSRHKCKHKQCPVFPSKGHAYCSTHRKKKKEAKKKRKGGASKKAILEIVLKHKEIKRLGKALKKIYGR